MERVCQREGCGIKFTPLRWNQIYHNRKCRFIVNARKSYAKHFEKKRKTMMKWYLKNRDKEIIRLKLRTEKERILNKSK